MHMYLIVCCDRWLLLEATGGKVGPALEERLDDAKSNGLNLIRAFAHGVFTSFAVQNRAGVHETDT